MTDDVKGFIGLGFSIDELDPEDYAEFPCSMHKLDEERDSHPCPEEPFVFFGLDRTEWDICLCKRHFAQFAGDMQMALTEFGRNVEGIDTDPHAIVQDGQVVTSSAFTEMFMDAKDHLNGRNT